MRAIIVNYVADGDLCCSVLVEDLALPEFLPGYDWSLNQAKFTHSEGEPHGVGIIAVTGVDVRPTPHDYRFLAEPTTLFTTQFTPIPAPKNTQVLLVELPEHHLPERYTKLTQAAFNQVLLALKNFQWGRM